ncbi:MAG: flippase-like domain-containing protein [Candidatus Marinimicrobia bacterium]|jgi:hypothetical protein|nr:flippase-like domain-containing protein [Candidatus Neomarinimicrobiota bacterium]MBT4570512.1 flippase-like domain-containing protein [Candidatus Neomarinimicrobiota bacterium]MBT4796632.1 flippase-like domain-containing protein [Candidatus Neomarinimicrobiota bacterium]MBT6000137.1 flippase-like domain-containing protein [Candidatus Neomarinimicrobiota bacterium]MBT6368894.1 flippase-like domain-containing protein [Candidatus Neomarinimicrobiota bacterium]
MSAGGLYYAFKDMDFVQLVDTISNVNYGWVALAMILMVFSVGIRAERWRLILMPFESLQFHPLFGSTMVGYFGNGVLPFRLGELLRAYSLSSYTKLTPSSSFGTIILERILDMLGLAAMIAIFAPSLQSEMLSTEFLLFVGVISLLIFVGTIWLGNSHSKFHEKVIHWKIFESKWAQKILFSLNNVLNGITALKNTKHIGMIAFHTVFLWVLYYISVWLVVKATGINLGFSGMGILLISTTLAITIPSAPGYVGTYHAAAVYILTNVYEVALTHAQAFAVIIHAIGFFPLLVIGAIYFVKGSIRIVDLKKSVVPDESI